MLLGVYVVNTGEGASRSCPLAATRSFRFYLVSYAEYCRLDSTTQFSTYFVAAVRTVVLGVDV